MALLIGGCHSDGGQADGAAADLALGGDGSDLGVDDLATGDDLAVAADLATGADLAMVQNSGDMAGPSDLALAGSAPVLLSPVTRPTMACPLAATSTSGTLFMWTQATAERTDGISSLDNWAFVANNGTTTHGEHFVPVFGGTTCGATLLPFGSSFLFASQAVDGTYIFNGTGLIQIAAAGYYPPYAVSGANAITLGIGGGTATVYDVNGTQVSMAALTGAVGPTAVAGDGAGGFAAAYATVSGTTATINVRIYSGGTWSAPEAVATAPVSGTVPTITGLSVASGAGTWAVSWLPTNNSTILSVAIRASGPTWTTTSNIHVTSALYALAGNATTLAVAAFYSSPTGYQVNASVYGGTTWTTTTVDTKLAYAFNPFGIVSTGSGYVMNWTTNPNNASGVSIFNGTSWTTPITVGPSPAIASSNGVIAVCSPTNGGPAQATLYASGAWDSGTALSSAASPTGVTVAPTATGFIAAYVDNPVVVTTRAWTPSTWAAASTLPANLQTGAANETSLAEGPNGHALAFFAQYDLGNTNLYAAEFDGTQWGSAVLIATNAFNPTVVAFAGAFELSWTDGTDGFVAKWAGASTAPIALFNSSHKVPLAWNGTTLMAASAFGGTQVATSTDGVTWSTPVAVDALNFEARQLVGSSAGFALQTTYIAGAGAHVLVSQGGTWSAPVTMTSATNGCQLAATSTTFLAVCSGTTLEAKFWQGGTFSDVPPSSSSGNGFALASDGTNYRLEYGGTELTFAGGAWSSPTTEANLGSAPNLGLVAFGDSWRLLTRSGQNAARAAVVGNAIFGAATPIESSTGAVGAPSVAAGPTRVDAVWTKANVGTFKVPAVYVRTGI